MSEEGDSPQKQVGSLYSMRSRPQSAPLGASKLRSLPSEVGSTSSRDARGGRFKAFNGAPKQAWDPGSIQVPLPTRVKVHIQGMVNTTAPEKLAEELFNVNQQLAKLKEEQKRAATDKHRQDAEIMKMRQNVIKAEELLNTRERLLSPTQGLSKMYKNPDTTSLVNKLKDDNRAMKATQDKMAEDLSNLQRNIRATRISELENEKAAYVDELKRQREMNRMMAMRLARAEALARESETLARESEMEAKQIVSMFNAGEGALPVPAANGLSAKRVRKTLQHLMLAQRGMLAQVALLKSFFPPNMSEEGFMEKAGQRPQTVGAPEVLVFLRQHIERMQNDMRSLPGAPVEPEPPAAAQAGARGTPRRPLSASSGALPPPYPTPPAAAPNSAPQLLEGVTAHINKLRPMTPDQFLADPILETSMVRLKDVMGLFIEEVNRLEGNPTPEPAVRRAESMRSVSRSSSRTNPLFSNQPPKAVVEQAAPTWPQFENQAAVGNAAVSEYEDQGMEYLPVNLMQKEDPSTLASRSGLTTPAEGMRYAESTTPLAMSGYSLDGFEALETAPVRAPSQPPSVAPTKPPSVAPSKASAVPQAKPKLEPEPEVQPKVEAEVAPEAEAKEDEDPGPEEDEDEVMPAWWADKVYAPPVDDGETPAADVASTALPEEEAAAAGVVPEEEAQVESTPEVQTKAAEDVGPEEEEDEVMPAWWADKVFTPPVDDGEEPIVADESAAMPALAA